MTGLIKGALITLGSLVPVGTLFFMLNANNSGASEVATTYATVVRYEDQLDIAEVQEVTEAELQTAEIMADVVLVDEFSPIKAIRQRDTLASVSIQEAVERTGLTREQITTSLVNNVAVDGYLFEFDHENAAIFILMPPDTSVYPNMEEAVVLTEYPKELIILSITEQKTVEGTKFEYEK